MLFQQIFYWKSHEWNSISFRNVLLRWLLIIYLNSLYLSFSYLFVYLIICFYVNWKLLGIVYLTSNLPRCSGQLCTMHPQNPLFNQLCTCKQNTQNGKFRLLMYAQFNWKICCKIIFIRATYAHFSHCLKQFGAI